MVVDDVESRVLYLGWLGRGNLGDEALWQAFAERVPGAIPFTSPSRMLARAARLFRALRMAGTAEALIRRHNCVCLRTFPGRTVVLGGGTLIGSPGWLDVLGEAFALGYRAHSFGTGMLDAEFWAGRPGFPADMRDHLGKWQDVLGRFETLSVRGVRTQQALERLGLTCQVTGDPVVLFTEQAESRSVTERVVGLNWGDARGHLWGGEERLVGQALRSLANGLASDGWKVLVFAVYGPDAALCREWIATLKRFDQVELIIERYDPRRYIQLVRRCAVFVGMKLHATALAFVGQVPSIMLEYRPKCADFMETMEAADRNVRCDRLDADDLRMMVETAYTDREAISRRQHEISLKYRRRIGDHIQRLRFVRS
jgi:polysaccharide pyruvyl transferase WcaK-like protein